MREKHSRILSGMRPTGRLHLGHYYGAIRNWVSLQYEHDCYFMVADTHALTTHYENVSGLRQSAHDMVVDWLACGVDPAQSAIFVQSHVAAHAELHLLLSMITPLSWLERVPTYKDQIEKLSNLDLGTYGFLGYPLLQSADILLYDSKFVPVGEDQVSHVEITREIARRFNYLYGREPGFEQKAYESMKHLGPKKAALYEELLTKFQQNGDTDALEKAKFLLQDAFNLLSSDRERLFAFLENKSKVILTEPQALITETPKLVGLDGQKMSKSYNNTIMLREDRASISKKIKGMATDPARVRRTDAGDPNKCPVWQLHKIYSDEDICDWVKKGCTSAGIGCLDCKQPVIEAISREQEEFMQHAVPYLDDPNMVKNILADGAEKATVVANATLQAVKEAMKISE